METDAPLPPRVQAILQQAQSLSEDERHALLEALGDAVALQAWSGSCCAVPTGSAPTPSLPSSPARVRRAGRAGEAASSASVAGCPWCRRPLTILAQPPGASPGLPNGVLRPERCAYVALLYGPSCHAYFLGALVLGWGLRQHATLGIRRVLMHTMDVPQDYLAALSALGWECQPVEYLSSVASSLFHNWRKSRFVDVFTKLRALQLMSFDKVLLLDIDLLVRPPATEGTRLEALFELRPPAAMKRGPPVPRHGERVQYAAVWEHPTRRVGDELPAHQQASGINAGVMLLRPDEAVFAQMQAELLDWYHPEHYATYMPEQEYLGRFYGTFDEWTHIDCRFNLEIDKGERIPHDWTEAHELLRAGGAVSPDGQSHPGAVVLHYSGTGVKPWDLLFERRGDPSGLRADNAAGLRDLLHLHRRTGPGSFLDGYVDVARLWAALLEWWEQLACVCDELAAKGLDPLMLVKRAVAAAQAADGAGVSSGQDDQAYED